MRWMLGFQRRLVRRWEWLTRIPTLGCLPQTSQTADMEAEDSSARAGPFADKQDLCDGVSKYDRKERGIPIDLSSPPGR
jgi:hypothetical protein